MSIASKAFLLGTVSLVALSSANAVQAQPRYSWTGFYTGATGGVALHHSRITDTDGFLGFGDNFTVRETHASPIFGVHAGYNIQSGSFVGGIEADFNVLGSSWTRHPDSETFVSSRIPWLATVRGRVGFVWNPFFYGTVGVAFADIKNQFGIAGDFNGVISSSTRTGIVYGGGIEHKLWPDWIARIEVLFVDFGRRNITANIVDSKVGSGTFRAQFKNSLAIIRTGLSFQW